jgi:hypothetical protein
MTSREDVSTAARVDCRSCTEPVELALELAGALGPILSGEAPHRWFETAWASKGERSAHRSASRSGQSRRLNPAMAALRR